MTAENETGRSFAAAMIERGWSLHHIFMIHLFIPYDNPPSEISVILVSPASRFLTLSIRQKMKRGKENSF